MSRFVEFVVVLLDDQHIAYVQAVGWCAEVAHRNGAARACNYLPRNVISKDFRHAYNFECFIGGIKPRIVNFDVTCRMLNMCYYTLLYENEQK